MGLYIPLPEFIEEEIKRTMKLTNYFKKIIHDMLNDIFINCMEAREKIYYEEILPRYCKNVEFKIEKKFLGTSIILSLKY